MQPVHLCYYVSNRPHFIFCCITSEAISLVRPFSMSVNHHPSNSHPLLRPSPFSLSLHLNPSLRYHSTLVSQCVMPLKPSILPVWVSMCYKHSFTHKPQLPEHVLLCSLLTLRRWLSNNNPSLPTNHHRPAIPVIAAQGPQGGGAEHDWQAWLKTTPCYDFGSLRESVVGHVNVTFQGGWSDSSVEHHVNAFFPFGKRQEKKDSGVSQRCPRPAQSPDLAELL